MKTGIINRQVKRTLSNINMDGLFDNFFRFPYYVMPSFPDFFDVPPRQHITNGGNLDHIVPRSGDCMSWCSMFGQSSLPAVRLNVSETPEEYHVNAELGGMKKEDVKVRMEEGVLTIEGEKEKESIKDTETMHLEERSYGKVQRSIRLPDNAVHEGAEATFKDGVLKLVIKKKIGEESSKTQIPIN